MPIFVIHRHQYPKYANKSRRLGDGAKTKVAIVLAFNSYTSASKEDADIRRFAGPNKLFIFIA